MNERGAMLHAALDYAARGWPVFPCSPRDKTPLVRADRDANDKPIKGTGGVKKATTDAEQIAAWWQRWPDAMIGVAMGENGLYALDFDPRTDSDTGEEWTLDRLKGELETQIGTALPSSLAGRTPSGGVHIYFLQPRDGPPIRNRGNLPHHVDVRGAGGYVIAPPSCMSDGRRYRWLRDDAAAEIVHAPAPLVAILQASKGASRTGGQNSVAEADARQRYAAAALDRECDAIRAAPSGKRQDSLNRGAFSVAQLVAAGALGETAARTAVMAAALANPGNDDQGAIEATVDSGWVAGLAAPRDLSTVGARTSAPGRAGPRRAANDDRASGGDPDALHLKLCRVPFTDLGNAERFVHKADLYEISLVAVPALPSARVLRVASIGGVRDIEELLHEAGLSGRKAKAGAAAAWRAINTTNEPDAALASILTDASTSLSRFHRS